MNDMIALLNDLSYIPPNNEQNEPTQGDISETSNEPTQAKRNEFEVLYASANEELYPGCDYVTRLDFMAKFTYFKVKGLVADGFNPFGNLSQAYSMWPVILITYNLPPWLCMKESSFMLTLLIPGPKSLGKDIDVYLRPLINDLKVLWALKGVETIDVATGQKFNMRAMMESSSTREYPSLIHTFFMTHTVGGVFVWDEDRALYTEMLRLQSLGSNTEIGVPYTKEEIMAIVRKGKQRGHLPGVGRVLSGCATGGCPPPPQSTVDLADVEKLKRSNKSLTKKFGGASGSGGCGDDESGGDEDGDEDEEDGDS
ncbi:reverse transcriptase domain-containing protein [Tanacetum coccineum]